MKKIFLYVLLGFALATNVAADSDSKLSKKQQAALENKAKKETAKKKKQQAALEKKAKKEAAKKKKQQTAKKKKKTSQKEKTTTNDMSKCLASKNIMDNYEPRKFPKTNNLLSTQGQPENYKGEKILLQGVVVDKNCVPVANATVNIWQMDASGKFPYKTLRNIASGEEGKIGESSFLGAGTAVTNNTGNFFFITILPTTKSYPHINVRVSHRQFDSFQTQYTMEDSAEAAHDEAFTRDQDTGKFKKYRIFYVKLVAPYENKTRHY